LVTAFIRAGELVQGLADAEFEARGGVDDVSVIHDAGARLLLGLAQPIAQSWRSGFTAEAPLPPDWPQLLKSLDAPAPVRIKPPEGYAFYALYPESYIEAARRSRLGPETIVIGIRSIGVGLAALVAAAMGAAPAVTVRPVGHPFSRRIQVAPALARRILQRTDAAFAIVDEGPGLSGSSFGCVADWLEAHGVPRRRLHFFPSHPSDLGREACDMHRGRWSECPRHVVAFDELLLRSPEPGHNLDTWLAELVGPLDRPLQHLSGGAWRQLDGGDDTHWTPSDTQLERLKFLAVANGKRWLVKFAGIGDEGQRKLRKANVLSTAGFTPKVAGFCHGFLVQEWIDGTPLKRAEIDRDTLLEALGQYLGFRARYLTTSGMGASLSDLFAMAVHNTGSALGESAAASLKVLLGSPDRFAADWHPVDTDNRLHAWEWLVTPDKRLIKTDALDHSAAHDLIGCQDIAWDIAGAAVELALSERERWRLARIVARISGRPSNSDLLTVLELCYIGFQIGLWTFAAASAPDTETPRIEALLANYKRRLSALLASAAAAATAATSRGN